MKGLRDVSRQLSRGWEFFWPWVAGIAAIFAFLVCLKLAWVTAPLITRPITAGKVGAPTSGSSSDLVTLFQTYVIALTGFGALFAYRQWKHLEMESERRQARLVLLGYEFRPVEEAGFLDLPAHLDILNAGERVGILANLCWRTNLRDEEVPYSDFVKRPIYPRSRENVEVFSSLVAVLEKTTTGESLAVLRQLLPASVSDRKRAITVISETSLYISLDVIDADNPNERPRKFKAIVPLKQVALNEADRLDLGSNEADRPDSDLRDGQ